MEPTAPSYTFIIGTADNQNVAQVNAPDKKTFCYLLQNLQNPRNLLSGDVHGDYLPRKPKKTSDLGTFLAVSPCFRPRVGGDDLELNSAGPDLRGLNHRRQLRKRNHSCWREVFCRL